jgi:multisubunit Na+/H+ antiporter MnhE subunit
MSRILVRAVALTGVYLLVLTSVAPGDVLTGGVLGLAVALALPVGGAAPSPARLVAAAALLGATAAEVVRGSWRTVRFCLGARCAPGFVEIPRGDRSRHNVALWGVLTGLAPDEVVADVDEDRDMLVVHHIDASDPEAERARHASVYEELQRKVVP